MNSVYVLRTWECVEDERFELGLDIFHDRQEAYEYAKQLQDMYCFLENDHEKFFYSVTLKEVK